MQKNNSFYIGHIKTCIEKIQLFTAGFTEAEFLANPLVQDAVIRNFEIIGEATKKLSPAFKEQYPDIPWRKIAGMRDKLIHDYIGVDLAAVWAVVIDILPALYQQITEILNSNS